MRTFLDELLGPRGRLPQRGQPDTRHRTALLVLAGLIVAGAALRLERPLAMDQRAQLDALDPSGDDVDGSVLLPRRMQGDDVGVVERGHNPGFAAQALPNDGVACHVGLDELERHGPVEAQLAGATPFCDPIGECVRTYTASMVL